jgi:Gpi18-like mannosyltransferase
MVYSESLYLLSLVAAAYAFRTRRWWGGALAGAVMTATRVIGVMAVPAFALLAWSSTDRDSRSRMTAGLAVAASLGIGLYSLYDYVISPSPFTWYTSDHA